VEPVGKCHAIPTHKITNSTATFSVPHCDASGSSGNLTVMKTVIQVDSSILGGTPVFQGTRVPIQNLFDYIEGDETIDEFLTDFPTVTKEQAIQLLEQLKDQALKGTKAA
jgi:uncharacterized protein (DUF433 family)